MKKKTKNTKYLHKPTIKKTDNSVIKTVQDTKFYFGGHKRPFSYRLQENVATYETLRKCLL